MNRTFTIQAKAVEKIIRLAGAEGAWQCGIIRDDQQPFELCCIIGYVSIDCYRRTGQAMDDIRTLDFINEIERS